MGNRQYILSHRQSPQDPVDEVGRPFVHAPSCTARTHSTAFARKRNQMLGRTTVTAKASKAPRQKTAGQKLAQLTLQKGGQRYTAASGCDLTQEGLQVSADHAVQDTYLRLARAVGEVRCCRHTHDGSDIHADGRPSESWRDGTDKNARAAAQNNPLRRVNEAFLHGRGRHASPKSKCAPR